MKLAKAMLLVVLWGISIVILFMSVYGITSFTNAVVIFLISTGITGALKTKE